MTIEYGIQLGKKCYVAKLDGVSTTIVPNSMDMKDYVYSAVYIREDGVKFIGEKAKSKIAVDPLNGYSAFNLSLGSDKAFRFEASGTTMTACEMTAEVFKALGLCVKARYGSDLRETVITVPADSTPLHSQDIFKAGQLAGFECVVLLQEPVAAAMAYGFDSFPDEVWMVYDFDGDRFEVSVLKNIDGEIISINSHRENIGGKFIDSDIVEKLLVPEVIARFGLDDFKRSNYKYIKQFSKLAKAANDAKKELSSSTVAEIDIENFIITDDGDVEDFRFELTRDLLDEIMGSYMDRTIRYCLDALREIGMSKDDVDRIVLAGGTTLSPYVHERLNREFAKPVMDSIDPITAAARGAAIYGAKQP